MMRHMLTMLRLSGSLVASARTGKAMGRRIDFGWPRNVVDFAIFPEPKPPVERYADGCNA